MGVISLYLIQMLVRIFALKQEGWDLPKLFPKLMLMDIEFCGPLADVGHFICLERSNFLFDRDAVFLCVVPFFWQFLFQYKC